MSRSSLAAASLLLVVGLAGCPKRWQNGECDTSEACKDQVGYGKVCVQGRCQECGLDADCKAGFVCKASKCEPRPECEGPADCTAGKMCQAGKCVADPDACGADGSCPADRQCMGGRCVARPPAPVAASNPCDQLQSVYFGFDESSLTGEARQSLEQSAKCLTEGAGAIRVEGNCDERGTAEYNMHLGQRRADSVRKYLTGLGVPARNVSTVSFGKEKPVCSQATEDCWQRNRRGDLRRQ